MSVSLKTNAKPAPRLHKTATASTDALKKTMPKPLPKPIQAVARVIDLTEEATHAQPHNVMPPRSALGTSDSARPLDSMVTLSVEGGTCLVGSPTISSGFERVKRNIASGSQLPYKKHRLTASSTPSLGGERFPFYSKGTVAIITSTTDAKYQYRFHKAVLERNSDFFRQSLSYPDDSQLHVAANSRPGGTGSGVRYIFDLVPSPFGHSYLVRRDPRCPPRDVASATPSTCKQDVKAEDQQALKASSKDSSGPSRETLEAYNSLFLAFYNLSPTITTDDIDQALSQAEQLLSPAIELGSLSVVRPHVNSALSQYCHQLFAAISRDPPRWLKLAIKLESALIFTESIIHVVGCWPSWPWCTPQESLDDKIEDMIARKARSLADMRSAANHDLFLNTIEIVDGPEEGPVNLKSRFETWVVIQVFRDWVATSMADLKNDDGSVDTTNIGLLYRTILKGGDAYLPLTEIHPLLREHGTGRHGLVSTYDHSDWEEVADDLKLLKYYAAGAVKDVCKNNLMLDAEATHLRYLTSVDITPEDLPWTKSFLILEENQRDKHWVLAELFG